MYRFLTATLLTLLSFTGSLESCCYLSFGPEIFHFHRFKEGGTFQNGEVDGVRIGFDRIKRYCVYVGFDYLYATGSLKGETATGRTLSSYLTDRIFEARAGYTLQTSCGLSFITPFAGWGYFHEENDFHPPSPLPCTFTDTFSYFAAGFLSGVNFNSYLSVGFNFKLRFMLDGRSEVTNDPLFDTVTLLMKEEMHVRVDVPFVFTPPKTWLGISFLLSPFFEYRHFGGREGFPFNFRDTKFYLFGARFAFIYRF